MSRVTMYLLCVLVSGCLASSPPPQHPSASIAHGVQGVGNIVLMSEGVESGRPLPSRETCRAVDKNRMNVPKFLRECLDEDKRGDETVLECVRNRWSDARATQFDKEQMCSYSASCQEAVKHSGRAEAAWANCFRDEEIKLKVHEEICEDEEREIDRAAGVEVLACD